MTDYLLCVLIVLVAYVVGFLGQGSIAPVNRLRADIGVFVALGAALVGGFVLWLVLRGVWDLIGVS